MSDIVVRFRPDGERGLIEAINKLDNAQKGLGNTQKKTTKTTQTLNAKMLELAAKYGSVDKAAKAAGVSSKIFRRALKGQASSINLVNASLKKTNASMGIFGTLFKRNATGASNLALSFSTMRSKLLLVNFALGMGINQLAKFAQAAAKVQAMETAFNTLSGGSQSAAIAIDKLGEATNGTLSNFDMFQQANNAMILGVTKNSDEMADLFAMAKKLGDALGRDTASSVESLVTGIGRQSRMMLDNLGIIVDTEKAYEDYAREINKTSSTLTDAEKKQAFMNATLTAARQKIKDLPEGISENNEAFQQFNASMSNLNESVGKAFLPLMTGLANAATALANAMSPDRVKAYAFIIGVALVGALIAYEKQLKKVIIQQSRTGWGLAATAVGFLITELTISTMFMKESAKESENLADETKKLKDEMEELANTKAAEALEKYYDTLIKENNRLKLEFAGLGSNLLVEFENALKMATGPAYKGAPDWSTMLDTEAFLDELALITGNIDIFSKFGTEQKNNITFKVFSKEQEDFALNLRDLMDDINEGTDHHITNQKELEALLIAAQVHFQKEGQLIDMRTMKLIVANEKQKADNLAITESQKNKNEETEKEQTIFELLREEYEKLDVAKIEQLKIDIDRAFLAEKLGLLNNKEIAALKAMKKEYADLTDETKKNAAAEEENRKARMKSVAGIGQVANAIGAVGEVAGIHQKDMLHIQIVAAAANAYKAASDTWADTSIQPTILRGAMAASHFATAYANVRGIQNEMQKLGGSSTGGVTGEFGTDESGAAIGGYNQGGYVPSSAGSGMRDDVPAMLTAGEFVMSRNAVDSIGLETLNQMNQSGGGGSINVNVSGNVLTKDFVEGELAESIKEAVRKGSDFGLS